MNSNYKIDLSNQVAIITGSGRNIGKAIALELARYGATIVVNAKTNRAEAETVMKLINDNGGEAISVLADVGNETQVQQLIDTVLTRYGRIDILINNAGLRRSCALTAMTTDEWRQVLAVNLDAPFFCCRAVAPSMIAAKKGSIINISGLNAHIGRNQWAHVCASKTGALGLTRALAVELAPYNITVNHVTPGAIDTSRSHGSDMLDTAKRLVGIPLGRLGLPQEIAAMCAFLVSDGARFITGQTFHVNGGALRC
jgi:3-oxoacyl-[acyl-carrier protein] reductase